MNKTMKQLKRKVDKIVKQFDKLETVKKEVDGLLERSEDDTTWEEEKKEFERWEWQHNESYLRSFEGR